jgi:hypothetical protein
LRQPILEGCGQELTGSDVIDAYFRFLAAADKLGVSADARRDVLSKRNFRIVIAMLATLLGCGLRRGELLERAYR